MIFNDVHCTVQSIHNFLFFFEFWQTDDGKIFDIELNVQNRKDCAVKNPFDTKKLKAVSSLK